MASRAVSARRYAEAIIELARETNTLDVWVADLRTITGFMSDGQVKRLLASTRVPREEKLKLLATGVQEEVSPMAWNLVRLLEQRGKIELVPDILAVFQAMVDDSRGIAHALVTTAVALDDDERAMITSRLSTLTGKQIELTSAVDASIIGGLVARIGDQLIDGSTKSKLIALKRRLEGASR
jgi:F-type H+-transporting ATPase subunit delta